MALTSVADIKAAVANGYIQKSLWFWQGNFGIAVGNTIFRSMWGENSPTHTDSRICTKTTLSQQDGVAYFNDPQPGNQIYLLGIDYSQNSVAEQAVIFLYDRLWDYNMTGHASGTTIAAPQGPDRNPSGIGNFIFMETRTSGPLTPTSATCSYTNQDGMSGRTATFNNILTAGKVVEWAALEAGDSGVQSIQSYTFTGSVPNGWLVIGKPVGFLYMSPTGPVSFDTVDSTTQFYPMDNNSCLSLFEHKTGGSGAAFTSGMTFTFVEG